MPLIAITRELGALGTEIAAKVAGALQVPLIHREVADRAARHWGVPSHVLLDFGSVKPPAIAGLRSAAARNVAYLRAEVLSIAVTGKAVFRGWGAAQVFIKVPHALSVRIGAPFNVRVARLHERLGLERKSATRMVRENDTVRAQLARIYAGIDWRDANGYDLLINTERSSVDDAVEEIVTLARRPTFQETPETRLKLENLRLEALARAALLGNSSTRDLRIHVKAAGAELILGGILANGDEREEVIRTLTDISAGISITSRLRAATDYRTRSSSI